MPVPFRTVFKRRAVRKVLLPFTLGLVVFGLVAFSSIG